MVKDLIYDIGMNNGDDTAYYLHEGFRVIAVDASPDLVKQAAIRFEKEIEAGQLQILNIGIASTVGSLDFYLNKHDSVWNSFFKEIAERGGAGSEVIKVETKPVDLVVREFGLPYYMKIDIEGYDIICLTSLANLADKPKYISVEVYELAMFDRLKELGYTKFKIIDQYSFLPLDIPLGKDFKRFLSYLKFKMSMNFSTRVIRKLFGSLIKNRLEKRYKEPFTYNHPYGSSGPFGERLPGRWLTLDEAINVYTTYSEHPISSLDKNGYSFWNDVHATY